MLLFLYFFVGGVAPHSSFLPDGSRQRARLLDPCSVAWSERRVRSLDLHPSAPSSVGLTGLRSQVPLKSVVQLGQTRIPSGVPNNMLPGGKLIGRPKTAVPATGRWRARPRVRPRRLPCQRAAWGRGDLRVCDDGEKTVGNVAAPARLAARGAADQLPCAAGAAARPKIDRSVANPAAAARRERRAPRGGASVLRRGFEA